MLSDLNKLRNVKTASDGTWTGVGTEGSPLLLFFFNWRQTLSSLQFWLLDWILLAQRSQHYLQRLKYSTRGTFKPISSQVWPLEAKLWMCNLPSLCLCRKQETQLLSPFHHGKSLVSSNSTLSWLDLEDSRIGRREEVINDRSNPALTDKTQVNQ